MKWYSTLFSCAICTLFFTYFSGNYLSCIKFAHAFTPTTYITGWESAPLVLSCHEHDNQWFNFETHNLFMFNQVWNRLLFSHKVLFFAFFFFYSFLIRISFWWFWLLLEIFDTCDQTRIRSLQLWTVWSTTCFLEEFLGYSERKGSIQSKIRSV